MNYKQILDSSFRTKGVSEIPPTSFSDTRQETIEMKQLIQNSLDDIFSEVWNFRKSTMTFQTVAGQASYDMPLGIIEKSGVSVEGNTYPLVNEKQPYSLTAQSGTPQRYYVQGDKLVLHPTPNAVKTVQIHYLNLMLGVDVDGELKERMELETDSPNIPSRFHDLIVRKTELAYMRDRSDKNNAQAMADVKKRISQLTDLDRGTLEASPIIIM
jgi:hypothetical protein